jgi:hypothetical protein
MQSRSIASHLSELVGSQRVRLIRAATFREASAKRLLLYKAGVQVALFRVE